jgi:predicted amidohydrolase
MKVAILQFAPYLEEKEKNLNKVLKIINKKKGNFEILVLPELFSTGYFLSKSSLKKLAEKIPNGETTQFLTSLSKQLKTTICAGIAEKEKDKFYNSAVIVRKGKYIGKYRKIHLFYKEKLLFKSGSSFFTFKINNVKFGIMICFDWLFPETVRSLALDGCEVIVHCANLVLPWCQSAMKVRAVENRIFILTSNRVGKEEKRGEKFYFTGKSQVVAPNGEVILSFSKNKEELKMTTINPKQAKIKKINKYNNLFKDRKPEIYKLN